MNIFQILIWVTSIISAYKLWDNKSWLSIIVIILALSYVVGPDEKQHYAEHGEYNRSTATRLMLTFSLVIIIFLYSILR